MTWTEEFAGVTAELTVPDTDAAVRFYRAAFGADELARRPAGSASRRAAAMSPLRRWFPAPLVYRSW
jgi:uncharacterized glyoxalase superfamily protein PhnB